MVNKTASEKYIIEEEKKYLGKEIGNFFAQTNQIIAGYESIKVELTSPVGGHAYNDWVCSAFCSALETWNKSPEYPVDAMMDSPFGMKEKMLLDILKERPISVALEGAKFTFRITGVPRSLTAQICRHRKMAFGERSMRVSSCYADPVRISQSLLESDHNDKDLLIEEYENTVIHCRETFKKLVQAGFPIEQSRNIMPIGALTSINATMDLSAMINYIRGRTSGIAMDEHTYMVCLLAKELKMKQPKFFSIVAQRTRVEKVMKEYGVE